jgi:DNA-binding NtrC family response regulator
MLSANILIADDDRDLLFSAEIYLRQYFETVLTESNPDRVSGRVNTEEVEVVVLDMNYGKGRMDGEEGLQLLQKLKQQFPELPVIVMTAYAEIDLAVEAVKQGAFDFITKPWKNEKLRATILSALSLRRSLEEVARLKETRQVLDKEGTEEGLIWGRSAAMEEVRRTLESVAPTEANVLILGENGVGKEMIARQLHQLSARQDGPFIPVDMGAIHENLFESELFGARKGAYTDLKADKTGRFELARGGTLFLDEIGNLPFSSQSRLLRVLQDRKIRPLGAAREKEIDIRLLSATNADIHREVAEGRFRQDLLYRINTIELVIPPLRERPEDIPGLIQHFMRRFAAKYQKPAPPWPAAAMKEWQAYPWPGNIRELKHSVERAIILHTGGALSADQLLPRRSAGSSGPDIQSLNLEELERQAIRQALKKYTGNVSRAADELGISRQALYRKMEKYDLG